MFINIIRPYMLIIAPAAIGVILLLSRYLKAFTKRKKWTMVTLRCIAVLLLVIAMAGVSFVWKVNTTTTIFVIDASDSTQASRAQMEQIISEALENMGHKDKAGIVAFGDNALVESFISKNPAFDKIETKVNGTYSNIENALTTAVSLMPQNTKKRIVLLSDGFENQGKSSKVIPSMVEQNIDFKVFKLNKNIGNEVAIENVEVPKKLSLGEEFNVVVNINSTVNTSTKLTLFSGREVTAEQTVQLTKGMNKFIFKDKAQVGGFRSYKITIEPAVDTEVKNNEASAFTNVTDKPRILIIEDAKGESDELAKMLAASEVDYTKVSAAAAPRTIQELCSYKTIITCNVSAENLNDGFLNSLESYVKDFGGGFIATGGENSFALGGYINTSLEKVLPVHMDMRGKKEIPDMSMMLIIDKSGSMTEGSGGITKLDIAKEAAARSIDSLRDRDEIGVLTFDDTLYWVVKNQKITDRKAIKDSIGTIRPGGGTSILPALEEGYNALKKSSAKIKHIILLTDGQAERSGYSELIEKISKDGITVSTVAVGRDADKGLLESLAKGGGGRFYFTDEFTNIPRIFAKEIFMAARVYLNNREFTPVIASQHPIIANTSTTGFPTLLGYVGASAKDTAKVLIKSDEDDPILTVWQYGLGKTAAWNSDINGKWSSNFIGWNKNIRLWQNIVDFTIENYNKEGTTIEVSTDGGTATVVLTNKDMKEELDTRAVIITPNLQNKEIKLYPVAPGKYSGSFELKETGAFLVKGTQYKNGEIVNAVNTGIALQYSPEYKINMEGSVLELLVKEGNGSFIKDGKDVFKGELKDISGSIDLTTFLLIMALTLFMVDIAFRRLNVDYKKFYSMALNYIGTGAAKFKLNSMKSLKRKHKNPKKIDVFDMDSTLEKDNIKNVDEVVVKETPKFADQDEKNTDKTNLLDTSKLLQKKNKKYR